MSRIERPCGSMEKCKSAPGWCDECQEFKGYYVDLILQDAIDRVKDTLDRSLSSNLRIREEINKAILNYKKDHPNGY